MSWLYQRKWINRCLIVLFLATIAYPFTRLRYHEWISYVFILVFLWHHYLNRQWFLNLWRGRYHWARRWTLTVNIAYLAATIVAVISGMLFSSLIPHPSRLVLTYAKYAHIVSAAWFVILTGCHLGIHADRVHAAWRKLSPSAQRIAVRAAWLMTAYGLYSTYSHRLFLKMAALYLKHPKYIHLADLPLFIFDHLAIVFAFAFLSAILHHQLRRLR